MSMEEPNAPDLANRSNQMMKREWPLLWAAIALTACDFQASKRSDYIYSSTHPELPDGGGSGDAGSSDAGSRDGALPSIAWRAKTFVLANPDGLVCFQQGYITPAVNHDNLNLLIVLDGAPDSSTWAL